MPEREYDKRDVLQTLLDTSKLCTDGVRLVGPCGQGHAGWRAGPVACREAASLMGLDNMDDMRPLPTVAVRGWRTQLRYWLIQKLAKNDPVLLNTIMVTPPGWMLAHRGIGNSALILTNTFVLSTDYEPMPGSLILSCQKNDDDPK